MVMSILTGCFIMVNLAKPSEVNIERVYRSTVVKKLGLYPNFIVL